MGCLQQTHSKCKDTNILKEKAWKIYTANNNQNKARVVKLKPGNVDFKTRIIAVGKVVYFIMINGSILQEYIIILNVYMHNNRASKYMK